MIQSIASFLTLMAVILGITALANNRAMRIQVAGLVTTSVGWFLQGLVYIAPTVAVTLARGLVRAFRDNPGEWQEAVNIFTEELMGGAAAAAGSGGGGAAGGVSLAALIHAQPLIKAITDTMAPRGDLTPESGEAALTNILSLNVALSLQGWWTEVVGDLVSLGRFGAALDLPRAVESALGLNRMTRLAWRAVVKSAITDPLTELYNRRYAFKKLTIGEGHQAWHRGLISDAEYLDVAAAAGYSHDRAAVLLELAKQPYSTAEIGELGTLLGIGDGQLIPLLREQGFDDNRARVILDLGRARVTKRYLDELVTSARQSFGRGHLNEQQLSTLLAEAGLTDRDAEIVKVIESLSRAAAKTLTVAELLTAYKEGVLTAQVVREDLRREGYADDDIDVLLALQHRVLSVAQILDLLTRGRLTVEEATRRLEAQGYSAADATHLTSLRGRRLSEGQVLDALRLGIINPQQATEDLLMLGFDQDQVLILLAFFRKTLSPADIQAAVVRGLLTEQQALVKLVDSGYSRDDAEIIVALDRRLLNAGQILDAFAAGIITRQEVLGDLAARGFIPDDALTLLRVFELHKEQAAARAATPPAGAPPATGAPHPPFVRRRRTVTPPPAPTRS